MLPDLPHTTRGSSAAAVHDGHSSTLNDELSISDAINTARDRLEHRRNDLQILSNTRRLLMRRDSAAAAALQSAQQHIRARLQRVSQKQQPTPATAAVQVSPEAGALTARVQQRMFTGDAAPEPWLSTFRAHGGFSVEDLVRMQGGGLGMSIDMSQQSLRLTVEDFRERTTADLPVCADEVCWFIQLHRKLDGGANLSVSPTLSSRACAASLFLMYYIFQVESALMLEEAKILELHMSPSSPASMRMSSSAPQCSGTTTPRPSTSCNSHEGAGQASRVGGVVNGTWLDQGGSPGGRQGTRGSTRDYQEGVGRSRTRVERISELNAHTHPGTYNTRAPGVSPEPFSAAADSHVNAADEAACPAGADDCEVLADESSSGGSFCASTGYAPDPPIGTVYIGALNIGNESRGAFLRAGVADIVPMHAGVHNLLEAIIQRFRTRIPHDQLMAPLELFLQHLANDDTPVAGPPWAMNDSRGSPGAAEDTAAGQAPQSGDGGNLHDHRCQGSFSVSLAVRDATDSILGSIKKEGPVVWQRSLQDHAAHLEEMRMHCVDMLLSIVLMTAYSNGAFYKLALVLTSPEEPQFCQVENMHARIYKTMRLSPSQKKLMVAVWDAWVKKRKMLCHRYHDALLPMIIWVPRDEDCTCDVETVSHAVASGGPDFRLRTLPEGPAHIQSPLGLYQVHFAQPLGPSLSQHTLPMRRFHCEDGRLLLDSPAAWVMSNDLSAASPGFIGQCPVATLAAAETLRRLRSVHDLDLRLYEDLQTRCMPGDVWTVQQAMHIMWESVVDGTGPVDTASLLQLAAQQQQRDRAFDGIAALSL